MALFLIDPEFLQALWDIAPKDADNKIHYNEQELDNFWHNGFVDTARIPFDEWKKIISQFKVGDKTYVLDKNQFMSLKDFFYKGEIRVPFDPLLINEGKYTNQGLNDLINSSIAPSCSLSQADLDKFMATLKADHLMQDGLINIDSSAKRKIKEMLDKYPSPLRRLEVMLDIVFLASEAYVQDSELTTEKIASAIAQQSIFANRPTSAIEEKAKALTNLTKAQKKKEEKVEKKGVELGKIRRHGKGMRG